MYFYIIWHWCISPLSKPQKSKVASAKPHFLQREPENCLNKWSLQLSLRIKAVLDWEDWEVTGHRAAQLTFVNLCSYFEILVMSQLVDTCSEPVQQQWWNPIGCGHQGFEECQYEVKMWEYTVHIHSGYSPSSDDCFWWQIKSRLLKCLSTLPDCRVILPYQARLKSAVVQELIHKQIRHPCLGNSSVYQSRKEERYRRSPLKVA